jgi:hypothetical protein
MTLADIRVALLWAYNIDIARESIPAPRLAVLIANLPMISEESP